jgi:uroporphyrinogen III methyltransferase/synthase
LTHRGRSTSVSFVAGHEVDAVDWKTVGLADTLVIFMGMSAFAGIAHELIAAGRPADTPAIAVRWGTRADQESLEGTLATLPDLIAARGLKPPATIIVGEVVGLRGKLNWFERLPLFGRRIVNTRPKGQADALTARLKALGADAIEMPTIEIRPADDYGPLDRALSVLDSYDWLIFTSANGVRSFLERLDASAIDLRKLRARICAIGPATRAAIDALHLKTDLMGREYVAEGLLAAFAPFDLAGKRVLLPRAAVARDLVPVELARRGAQIDVVEAYRTLAPEGAGAQAAKLFGAGRKPDCIAFTSSSTVQNFAAVAGLEALAGVKVASIGPVTTATALRLGIAVDAEARTFTVDGLVEAVLGLYTETSHSNE